MISLTSNKLAFNTSKFHPCWCATSATNSAPTFLQHLTLPRRNTAKLSARSSPLHACPTVRQVPFLALQSQLHLPLLPLLRVRPPTLPAAALPHLPLELPPLPLALSMVNTRRGHLLPALTRLAINHHLLPLVLRTWFFSPPVGARPSILSCLRSLGGSPLSLSMQKVKMIWARAR